MKEYCGIHFILNGEIRSVDDFDSSLVYKGDTIYEVIRMTGGTPVFFYDHMNRLAFSVEQQKKNMIADAPRIKRDIIKLNERDKRKEINIKIVFNYNEGIENYLIYYIESHYPTPEQYRKGVKGILFWAERQDPQAKVLNYRLKAAIHQEITNENAYEALLVNKDNLITEGSRSNVFFIKNGKLITAPDDVILNGITRKHILEICESEKIAVDFSCVNADDIGEYEAAFMSGTSPMVLPYCCINETFFNAGNPVIARLRRLYIDKVNESLQEFK